MSHTLPFKSFVFFFVFSPRLHFKTLILWKWKKVTWHVTKYGNPYSELVLCIYPIQVHTHSSEHTLWTHTPWTHTRSSEQPFMLQRPGSSWGFGALLSRGIEGERVLYIHSPPHRQFLPAQDSNSQPLGYKSDSLTIRPRLPLFSCEILMQIKMLFIPVMAKLNFQQPLLHLQCHMMILWEREREERERER